MPEQNKPLLEEAASIDFQFGKDGRIKYQAHTRHELGLYFIQQASKRHNNKYDYSRVQYKKAMEKVEIVCPYHGSFYQAPNTHLSSGKGCPHCSGNARHTTETFIEKARSVHGDKYDYSKVAYDKNNKVKLTIICWHHGPFSQSADDHLGGKGCPKCATAAQYDTEYDFILKAQGVHGSKYDYSAVVYTGSKTKVSIICKHHGEFLQEPRTHLQGNGCPKCAGQDHNILYLLKCLETGWYKIGITSNLKQRISSIGGNVAEVHHVVLGDPRKHESILHKKYDKDREYNLCVRTGNTEFFSLNEQQVQEVIAYMNEVSDEG